MNKVIYVKAFFKPVGKNVKVQVPTGEKKKGFLGREKDVMVEEVKWEKTGWSDCEIDGKRLTEDMANAISNLNSEGYELVSVSPVISGNYFYKFNAQGITSSKRVLSDTEKVSGGASYGFGYGYSYTEGITIIAKKYPA
jgi:hypothetical protein